LGIFSRLISLYKKEEILEHNVSSEIDFTPFSYYFWETF
jgi:hypothetical protein